MNKIQQGFVLLSLVSGGLLVSCSDESPWRGSDSEGGLTLELASDGRVMRRGTRADDTMCPIVPDGNQFAVTLTNADGSYSKNWDTPLAFNKEDGFPIGDYVIEATYGNIDHEGFELPYYYGKDDVHVSPGANTTSTITATLANAMVTVRYAESFTSNFPNYSAAVQTPGHDWVMFAQDENRPAFISPNNTDETKFSVTITNSAGKTVTVEPAKFKTLPRHHYVITVNATGNVESGTLALDIEFDDEVVAETVNVSLGDDLFSSPAPTVTPKDFTDGQTISLLEYETPDANPQFDIASFGGFSEVTLNFISTGYLPMFGASVQLVNASDIEQSQLENEGVKVYGLYKNSDKMAVVNVKELAAHLPAGEYTVQVQAKDALTRLSEPKSVKFAVSPVIFELSQGVAPDYKDEIMNVIVATNSSKLPNVVKFKAPDAQNRMVDAVVKSVKPTGVPEGSSAPYAYNFELEVAPVSSVNVDVEADYGKMHRTLQVPVNAPEYTVTVDAFAKFAVLKIDAESSILKEDLMNNLKIYNGSSQISPANISRDMEKGYITISGLNAATEYDALKGVLLLFEKPIAPFTTEAMTDIDNGDFSVLGEHYFFENIASGGKFRATFKPDYQMKSTIDRYAPSGWATLNTFTCYANSSNKNTWFMVPSTYIDNGTAVIRSVGYHHNGTDPALSNWAAATYSKNAPGELKRSVGELFLGSYSFNGTEDRTDGITFASRPMALSFDYKYAPINNEMAQVDISVVATDGSILAAKTMELSESASMQTVKIEMPSYTFGKKCARLIVGFRSTKENTTPSIHIPSGDELQQPGHNGFRPNVPANEYKAFAKGSELTIDNVHLSYDKNETVISAPRRANKR